MDREITAEIWELVEANLKELETSRNPQYDLLGQTHAALGMLLECHPEEVLRCVTESTLPTRAVVSWLAYEGRRMGMAKKVRMLERHWLDQQAAPVSLIRASGQAEPRSQRPLFLLGIQGIV